VQAVLKFSFGASLGIHAVGLSVLALTLHGVADSIRSRSQSASPALTLILEPPESPAGPAVQAPPAASPPVSHTDFVPDASLHPAKEEQSPRAGTTVDESITEPWPELLEPIEVTPLPSLGTRSSSTNAVGTEPAIGANVTAGTGASGHDQIRLGTASSGTPAGYLRNPKPAYPREARRRRQQGTVLVQLQVGSDGAPMQIELGRSSGFRLLDQAALAAVRGWTFTPALRGADPVASHVEVPIEFKIAP